MASILPVIILICGLCLCGIVPGLLIRPRTDVIPVNLRSVLSADYSADRRDLRFSAIDLGLVEDYWLDNDVSPTEAAQRVSTLTVLLQTPVPTVTPLPGQTRPQSSFTPSSPADVEGQATSPTAMPAVIQSASASPTPSPTSTVQPSASPLPSRTPSASASPTPSLPPTIHPSATRMPSRTPSASASPTPLPSRTPTGTTSPAPLPSRTASATLVPTPTASSTAVPTLLPSLTPTMTPPSRTLPSHPTTTPSFTPRPPTSTPLPTATPQPPTALPPPPTPEPPTPAPPAGELSVSPLCSDNPEVERRWSINHTGAGEVSFAWELLGGQGQSGTGSVGANASVVLSTGAKSGTTVIRVSAPGYQQVTAVNHGEACSPPPPPPSETPTDVPTATLEPSPTELPTQTPEPSATEVPTQTPEPTATPA